MITARLLWLVLALIPASARAGSITSYTSVASGYFSQGLFTSDYFRKHDPYEDAPFLRVKQEEAADGRFNDVKEFTHFRWNLGYNFASVVSPETQDFDRFVDHTHSFSFGAGWEAATAVDISTNVNIDTTPNQNYRAGTWSGTFSYIFDLQPSLLDSEPEPEKLEEDIPNHLKHNENFLSQFDLASRKEDPGYPKGQTLMLALTYAQTQHVRDAAGRLAIDLRILQSALTVALYYVPLRKFNFNFGITANRYDKDPAAFYEEIAGARGSLSGLRGAAATLAGFPRIRYFGGLNFNIKQLNSLEIGVGFTTYVLEAQPTSASVRLAFTRYMWKKWGFTLSGDFMQAFPTPYIVGSLGITYYAF